MEAKGKPFCKAQTQGFAAILKSAACEWFLIFLMLIDALLSYALTKFANICNLQTPCILCSRLDHLLGKEKPNSYSNILCTNHRLEISSLVSCYKHNKLADGNEMCDACLCSFATTNNKPKSYFKTRRLTVGKLRSDTGGNGAHGSLLNWDSIPHCIKTRSCSCCSKPWKTRPNAQGLLQLKSSLNVATKPHIPYPRCLNSRDSSKKMRDKIFGSVALQHPGKTGFNLLSHVEYNELRITSDSELEVLLSEEDDDKSLKCEKSELKEKSVLQSITQIPFNPHCNNCDQVKPSINFVGSRSSPLESYVQVDVAKPHDVKSLAYDATFHGLNELNWLPWPANPTANPSTWPELISLDDALSPAFSALELPRENSMEKTELTDSLNQESTLSCSPELITLHQDPQVVGKLKTSEETGTNNIGTASLNELEDHSTLTSTNVEECLKIDEVVNESSSENTNHDINYNSDSDSSESAKEHEVNFTTRQPLESFVNSNDDSNHNSNSESSESDKENEVNFATRKPLESSFRNTNDDIDHNNNSESSKTEKEHEVNFATRQPLQSSSGNTNDNTDHSSDSESSESDQENEVNGVKRQPLELSFENTNNDTNHNNNSESSEIDKVHEVNFATKMPLESSSGKTNNDTYHNSDSESSRSDQEHEVNCATRQPSEKENDIVTNDLEQTPLINTIVVECSTTHEVVYESAMSNTNNDLDQNSVSESSESDREQDVFNFPASQPLEKEIDLVANDLKQSTLISTTIDECDKADEMIYASASRNTIDDMDHYSVSESLKSDKEQEVINVTTGQFLENETDTITNNLTHSPLISTTIVEFHKTNEVACGCAIKNTHDNMDHSSVSESSESDKEHEIFNISRGQSLEKETDLLINTTIEDCPTTDDVVYESTIMNANDDMDHSSVSESSENKQQEVFNFATEQHLKTEPDIVTRDMEQFPLENNPAELVNHSSSDDEGHNFSICYDDLQEEFASDFNIIRAIDRSVSMESDVESLDGSNVSEIEGESVVDRLKRQVEYDKKCIDSLYKELEEERSASEVAASQAMAMITRLQEEKAAMHMEALHYLRMMEEQAEYDVEALEKANEVLNEKEREIQDLEAELEYYRSNYSVDTIVEAEHEKSDGANEENITMENNIVEDHEYNGNCSFKSTIVESSKGSYKSLNNQTSSLEFEDEKIYIQLCLKSLEDKINKLVTTNGLLARVPNCIDIEEVGNPEKAGEESIDAERSQMNNKKYDPSMHIDHNSCNGTVTPEGELVDPDKNSHFGSEENLPDVKGQISCKNKREEVDFLALEHKISDLTGRLEALQTDYDFLEHSLNSLRYGEEGFQFAQNIVHQLQELCKLGIRLDRQHGS